MKIVFLGNFLAPYSTESHHKWTWERMGHEVVALQENKATTDDVLAACQGAQLLQVTHTHGYGITGTVAPETMLQKVREAGIPSFGYHLDVYWGLNTLDKREDRIGKHWSWKTDYFFSTDGSHQAEYESRGVNHIWLPPAVVEYACYKGKFNPQYASEISFVGSVGYHPEYPFRAQLIENLRKRYGNRFRTYSGLREDPLNNAYASMKVVVGDHCFAGMPFYWSDRVPETCGRGGFLLCPRTEGLEIPTATYEPQNIASLFEKIDYYLAHEDERNEIRDAAFEHVRAHDTYTHRLGKILNIIGL